MMISTQTIDMSFTRFPQPGISGNNSPVLLSPSRRPGGRLKWSSGFRKGRGFRIMAIEQASPFSSSTAARAANASDFQVPMKKTGVRDFTAGIQNVEIVDALSPAKLLSTVDDQLPPLLSMLIDGLPPFKVSKYLPEAEIRLQQYVERYPDIDSWDSFCHMGLMAVNYLHPQVISAERFVAMAINYALMFLLDDFFFDTPDEFRHDEYGIPRNARESPQKIQEYLDHLDALYGQQVQPSNPAPLIETLMWESGREMLELSNPEWLRDFVASMRECHSASIESHAEIVQGHNSCFQNLESYLVMRVKNGGGPHVQMLLEFADNSYIPPILKATSYFQEVTAAISVYIGLLNDVFSYHKESLIEQNPRNVITVLMESEGEPLIPTMHRTIDLVNAYARAILDSEVEAKRLNLQKHLENIKILITGNVYFSYTNKRYRHPDSIFPELRDL